MGVSEVVERKEETGRIFEEIMAKNLSSLMKKKHHEQLCMIVPGTVML